MTSLLVAFISLLKKKKFEIVDAFIIRLTI